MGCWLVQLYIAARRQFVDEVRLSCSAGEKVTCRKLGKSEVSLLGESRTGEWLVRAIKENRVRIVDCSITAVSGKLQALCKIRAAFFWKRCCLHLPQTDIQPYPTYPPSKHRLKIYLTRVHHHCETSQQLLSDLTFIPSRKPAAIHYGWCRRSQEDHEQESHCPKTPVIPPTTTPYRYKWWMVYVFFARQQYSTGLFLFCKCTLSIGIELVVWRGLSLWSDK